MSERAYRGQTRTRPYTRDYSRLPARLFRDISSLRLGAYYLSALPASEAHKHFTLIEHETGARVLLFNFGNRERGIRFRQDDRSASSKLYFCCPNCNKSRQHLYAIPGGYTCRECAGLHYSCQSEVESDRLAKRIRKLRHQLWGDDRPDIDCLGVTSCYWEKPKWLRWNTFIKKKEVISNLEFRRLSIVCAHADAFLKRFK